MKTVARGARRPKSPFRGKLDLFFGGEITVAQSHRGELHPLREVVIHDWREGLRKSYVSTLLAGYFCQLLEAAVEPEHAEPDLHDLLRRALDHLHEAPPAWRAMRHFEAELARLLGVTDQRVPADVSLREALGTLPPIRAALVERLAGPADFDSSAREYGR